MNRNLRLKINESLETRILSKALLMVCLACLHEKITFSESTLSVLERKRNVIASTAVANGITKEKIKLIIPRISPQDYPTLKVVERVANICDSGNYSYDGQFIPEKMIHMKSEEELNADMLRIPPKKKRDVVQEELSELIRYIESEIMYMRLTDNMIRLLKELRCNEYPYSIMLQAFQWYRRDIMIGIRREFTSTHDKFKYMLGIVKNKLPDTKQQIIRNQKSEEALDYIFSVTCIANTEPEYIRKTDSASKWANDLW